MVCFTLVFVLRCNYTGYLFKGLLSLNGIYVFKTNATPETPTFPVTQVSTKIAFLPTCLVTTWISSQHICLYLLSPPCLLLLFLESNSARHCSQHHTKSSFLQLHQLLHFSEVNGQFSGLISFVLRQMCHSWWLLPSWNTFFSHLHFLTILLLLHLVPLVFLLHRLLLIPVPLSVKCPQASSLL